MRSVPGVEEKFFGGPELTIFEGLPFFLRLRLIYKLGQLMLH